MMRVLLSLTFFLTLSLLAEPHWADSYDAAFKRAKAEKKGVMVMLSQDGCKACWYMENIVFDEPLLVDKIEKDFVMLYLDVHDDDIHGLDYKGTPTLYFLSADDKVIKRLDGVYNIKELTAALLKVELPKEDKE